MVVIEAYLDAYYAIVIILGIPGNALILATYGQKKKKTGTDVLIMGLAGVDLTSTLSKFAKHDVDVDHEGYCKFRVYIGRIGIFPKN